MRNLFSTDKINLDKGIIFQEKLVNLKKIIQI